MSERKMTAQDRRDQNLIDLVNSLDWSKCGLPTHNHIRAVHLKNFKGYKGHHRIPIKPLTFIFGENNAGKSSFLDALQLLAQSFSDEKISKRHPCDIRYIDMEETNDLGNFVLCKNNNDIDFIEDSGQNHYWENMKRAKEWHEVRRDYLNSFQIGFEVGLDAIQLNQIETSCQYARVMFSIYDSRWATEINFSPEELEEMPWIFKDTLTSSYIGKIEVELSSGKEWEKAYEWTALPLITEDWIRVDRDRPFLQLTQFPRGEIWDRAFDCLLNQDWHNLNGAAKRDHDPQVDTKLNLDDEARETIFRDPHDKNSVAEKLERQSNTRIIHIQKLRLKQYKLQSRPMPATLMLSMNS